MRCPLIWGNAAGSMLAAKRMRLASATGAAATSAMKSDRRDHNICPSDRSKMRTAVPMTVGLTVGEVIVIISPGT